MSGAAQMVVPTSSSAAAAQGSTSTMSFAPHKFLVLAFLCTVRGCIFQFMSSISAMAGCQLKILVGLLNINILYHVP